MMSEQEQIGSLGGKEKGIRVAIRNAWRELSKGSCSSIARKSLAEMIDSTRLALRFAGERYYIDFDRRQVRDDKGVPTSDRRELLILHYLLNAKDLEPYGEEIGFAEIPEGRTYAPVFNARTVERLLKYFGKDSERIVPLAAPMGGKKGDKGDVSVVVPLFPRVPVTIIVWKGGEEFSPGGNILFDQSITRHLPLEDIVVGCEELVSALIARGMG